LEKLFHVILSSENFPEEMKNLANLKISIKSENLDYLMRLISFIDILENEEASKFSYDVVIKIKDFFDYCFVQVKCPKLMWNYTLKLIHEKFIKIFEIFRKIEYDDYKRAFDNHCSNEIVISKRNSY
jgi:hypothetical protein